MVVANTSGQRGRAVFTPVMGGSSPKDAGCVYTDVLAFISIFHHQISE